MKKYIKTGIGILIIVVLAFLYAHIDKNSYLYDRNADTSAFIEYRSASGRRNDKSGICK